MYTDVQNFLADYGHESDTTARVLAAITDASMGQAKAEGHNNLGDIAWHLATSQSAMLNQCGFNIPGSESWTMPAGTTVAQIQEVYAAATAAVKEQVAAKSPADLQQSFNMWGMMEWPLGVTLTALIHHEVHHRGQLSVLMRQAGLVVPSIYGPNKEMTAEMMAQMAASQG